MQAIACYASDDFISRLVEGGTLDPIMVTYSEDAVNALKNFSLRQPSLAETIFIQFNYKAHFPDIEMKPLNRLELVRVMLTNIKFCSLESVADLF